MRKRYDSYKDSGVEWIGEIPSHWELIKTFLISENLDGRRVPLNSEERGDVQGEIPYWGSGGIVDYINKYIFDEELLLVGEDGSPFFDSYRDVSFYVNEKIWVNNHIHILRSKKDKVDTRFLVHSFNSVDYKEYITGSTRDKLTQTDLNRIIHPIPPLSEQQQIVSFLDTKTSLIDSLIEKTQRKIELLKEKRTSLINEVVTKGLNPNVEMKDSGVEWIGEIPIHWELVKYKNLGDRFTNIIEVEDFNQIDVIHYSIPNVQKFGKGVKEFGGDIDSSKLLFKGGELIISKLNPRKSCVSIVESFEKSVIVGSGEFVVLYPIISDKKYLYYFLKTQPFTDYLDSSVESVTRSHQRVNPSIIYNTQIPTPPITEQHEIVKYLDEQTQLIDNTISIEEKRIELLKEYRQSLISEVVTGKLKVTTDE